MKPNTELRSLFWILLLSIVIFGTETVTPLGVIEAILYVGVILAGLSSRNRKIIYGALILSSLLTVVGHFISPVSSEPWKSVINRSFAITVFGIVTFVGLKRIQVEENLFKSEEGYRKLNIELEQRVIERTTELQRKNEQLNDELVLRKQAEARYGSLFEQSNDAVFILDLQGNHIAANSRAAEMLGYTVKEIQNLSVRDLSAEIEKSERILDRLAAGERVPLFERLFRKKNGEVFPVEINVELVRDDSGTPLHIQSVVRDITKRKQKEEAARRQNKMLADLHQITLDLLQRHEVEALLNKIAELSAAFLDAPYAEIVLLENEELVVRGTTGNQKKLLGERVNRNSAALSWRAFDTRAPAVLDDYSTWAQRRDVYDEFSLHAVADFPILNQESCIGVLAAGRNQPNYPFQQEQLQFGGLFTGLVALVIESAQLREALREQSIRDPLTGLFNRRYMDETLKREVSRMTRQLHPLGIIMADIDRFKSFNDTHGHAAGDALLQEIGKFLQSHIRNEDVACRYGGEEFILIMPDATLETVKERAELLRREATKIRIERVEQGVTLSLGFAIYPQHGKTIDEVISAADAALYQAKQRGRNRVMMAEKLE
ncbi:MAG: diguanylate cyclase [Anaerolineales bacterium]|nr:diguanylate cyclase [Anaerolineales bacterium]